MRREESFPCAWLRRKAPGMTDPLDIFSAWYDEAKIAEPNDPEAMALATVGPGNQPSVRMVLLKGVDARGFVFYTNRESRKAMELDGVSNATLRQDDVRAALLFHWKSLRRQVRIEGGVQRVGDDESDAYFASRSRDSQLGAWASDQSRPLEARELFERRFDEMQRRFDGQPVPRPPHWGGYRVAPERIEFWMDRAHRLHERRLFVRAGEGWRESLLYP